MKNSKMWNLAELGELKKGDVFGDEEGNEIIFTGKSFQVYFTDKDDRYDYVGMCLNDIWTYKYNDLPELQMQENERK